MENAYAQSTGQVLKHFSVQEHKGLSDAQVIASREKYGSNGRFPLAWKINKWRPILTLHIAIPEEPPTPIWELILEQFKDQLVIILLGSAAVSFVLALLEDGGGWTAFVDPAVVSIPFRCLLNNC